MVLVLFFSCIGIFSLGYFIQNSINHRRDDNKYFLIIPTSKNASYIEYTIRSCMLKVDLGQLKRKNVIIWDACPDSESSVIAKKLSGDFGFSYADAETVLNDVIRDKIDLQ